jgi:hypothetical protein
VWFAFALHPLEAGPCKSIYVEVKGEANMKMNPYGSSFALAAMLVFSASVYAQHGGGRPAGAGAMGGPSGMGPGMGMGGDMGMGASNRPSDIGSRNPNGMGGPSMESPNLRSQSPQSVLGNQHLESALTNALGKSGISVPGGNLQTACSGFKNLGQCVAAMHVAKNLNLNFSDLQSRMTGSNSVKLGKAIQELGGPTVNAKSERKKANKQANHDIHSVENALQS